MRKPLLAVAPLLCIIGCHHLRATRVDLTLDPHPESQSVDVTCNASTSNNCHLLFSHDGDTIATISVSAGSHATVRAILPGTVYCASAHQNSLETCKLEPLPHKRTTIKTETRITSDRTD